MMNDMFGNGDGYGDFSMNMSGGGSGRGYGRGDNRYYNNHGYGPYGYGAPYGYAPYGYGAPYGAPPAPPVAQAAPPARSGRPDQVSTDPASRRRFSERTIQASGSARSRRWHEARAVIRRGL